MPQTTNGFIVFLTEFRQNEEKRGVKFFGSFEAIAKYAGVAWTNLSAEEKNIFKEKARKLKQSRKQMCVNSLCYVKKTKIFLLTAQFL